MTDVFICSPLRTAIGRYGGGLSSVRTDDLAAIVISALMQRHQQLDWSQVDDVILGNANQAGECNRNIARMATLLAGLPENVSGTTINRLCGSGMDAVGCAARTIKAGEAKLIIAGGVESMSRAPFVMAKSPTAWGREAKIYDTTIGWRFPNPKFESRFGIDSMPETAENVAQMFSISRQDQDAFALRSQRKAKEAQQRGRFAKEIIPVTIKQSKKEDKIIDNDEHLRPETTMEVLSKLPTPFRSNGSVTAGNAAGVNDGACAMLVASKEIVERYQLEPMAKIITMASVGVTPNIMGIGPVPASKKALQLASLSLQNMDVIELNEAFAAQALAVIRQWGFADDTSYINPNGGAIALGHPLGMSGARLLTSAAYQLQINKGRYALCTMCIGVGQGIATIIERV